MESGSEESREPEQESFWESLGAGKTVPMTPPGTRSEAGPSQGKPQGSTVGNMLAGRYLITAVIGEGGMGKVYLAEDQKLNQKKVAVKLMMGHLRLDQEGRARFRREAMLQAKISHAGIIQILDVGECPQGSYIVMEFSDGRSLQTMIKELGKLSVSKALDIAEQLLEVLDFAHRQGVVHRDLKPSNILIESRAGRDVVRILDFGIAKALHTDPSAHETPELTQVGYIIGTPGYMAPEQATGETQKVDHRVDIYSSAVVLYHMLTGKLPCPKEARRDPLRYALWITRNEITPPSQMVPDLKVSQEVEDVLQKSLQAEAADRYQSAYAFLEALREARRYSDISTVRDTKAAAAVRESVRRRRLVGRLTTAGGWVLAALALIVVAYLFSEQNRSRDASKKANSGLLAARKAYQDLLDGKNVVPMAKLEESQARTRSAETETKSLNKSLREQKQLQRTQGLALEQARDQEFRLKGRLATVEEAQEGLLSRTTLLLSQLGEARTLHETDNSRLAEAIKQGAEDLRLAQEALGAARKQQTELEQEKESLQKSNKDLQQRLLEAGNPQELERLRGLLKARDQKLSSVAQELLDSAERVSSWQNRMTTLEATNISLKQELSAEKLRPKARALPVQLQLTSATRERLRISSIVAFVGEQRWQCDVKAGVILQPGKQLQIDLLVGVDRIDITYEHYAVRAKDWVRPASDTKRVSGDLVKFLLK